MLKWIFLPLLAAGLASQDDAETRKARRARINELRKQLNSTSDKDKIRAINDLAGIFDEDARLLLAGRLVGDIPEIRIAAAKAIAKHRKAASAYALGNALGPNFRDEAVLKALIEALGELDMCASLPFLAAAVELNKYALAADALKAIVKIGCPEAAPYLIGYFRKAEAEEAKPDEFEDPDSGTTIENAGKDKRLAGLCPTIRETVSQVSGTAIQSAKEWRGQMPNVKLTSVYLCEYANQTFDSPLTQPKKCPLGDGKKSHNDILLKHKRE